MPTTLSLRNLRSIYNLVTTGLLRGFIFKFARFHSKVLYLPFTPHFLSSRDRCVNPPDSESKCLGVEPPERSPSCAISLPQLNPKFRITYKNTLGADFYGKAFSFSSYPSWPALCGAVGAWPWSDAASGARPNLHRPARFQHQRWRSV